MKSGTTKIRSFFLNRYLAIKRDGTVGSTDKEEEAAEFYVLYH